jgi:hypothetical protein
MTFKDASSIQDAVEQMRLANIPCSENRAQINNLFNGGQPWTEEERKENKIFANFNSLEGPVRAHQAVQQLENALLKPGHFFNINLETGPRWARAEWSAILTEEVNRLLKRSSEWKDLISNMSKSVTLHGIAPVYWNNKYDPIPVELGIEDVLVPSRTLTNMRNLEFFAIYREWTYSELYDMTHGPQVDPGWNLSLVKRLMAELAKQPMSNIGNGNRWLMPEKLEEDLKENTSWFFNSTAPVVYAWDFFYRDESRDKGENWERRIVLDYQQLQPEGLRAAIENSDDKNSFLYDSSKRPEAYAKSWKHLIHWQFGNVSLVSPCRYYSVRSFGYLLYSLCLIQNHLRCRFTDAIFESTLQLFRNVGEDDRERLEKVDLMHMGIVPDGLSFVTKNERWEINEQLAMLGITQNQQLMDASSASYLPQAGGSQGLTPATATEELIKANTSAALTSAMLNQTYENITGMYREVCRRLTEPDSLHPMKAKLVARLLEAGIPEDALKIVMNADSWDIQPDRVLGGGNKAVETLQANQLMSARAAFDPQAQRSILYKFTLANSDAATARQLVPIEGPEPGRATEFANNSFATLMLGLPVAIPRDINPIEYITVTMTLLGGIAQQVEALSQTQAPGVDIALAEKLSGLFNAANHLQGPIQMLAQDEAMQQQAKQFMQALQELMAIMQPIAAELQQRMAQAQEQGQQLPPETQAKIATMMATSQAKSQIEVAKANQKMEHKDASFFAELERRNAKTAADIDEKSLKTGADIANSAIKTRADAMAEARKRNVVSE